MRALYACILGLVVGACRARVAEDFNSPEPAARNAAIVRAAAERDARAIPDLIRMLDSDDSATRLLTIGALERVTGQTLGYDPSDTEPRRREAVRAWQAWQQARAQGGAERGPGPR